MKLLMKSIFFLLPVFAFAQSKPGIINSTDQGSAPALLAAELIANDTTDRQKLNSVFRWVIANIDYNTKAFKNSSNNPLRDYRLEEDEDSISPLKPLNLRVAELVLKRRTAVCDGYARLFKTLCDYAGIKCEVITGYGRTNINRIGANFVSNHKWNAVFIDSTWQLLDATWASGFINYKDEFQREYNSHYFLSKPEEFILDHYPEDLRWALLSNTPALKEFESTPFKTTAFNRNYISSFKPAGGIIEASVGDSVTIEIETNRYKKTLWVADIASIDSNAIFILQCCGAIKPKNIISGNKISVQYKVLSDKIEWLNIIYDDELLMRYKLNIRKDSVQNNINKF